MSRPRLPTNVIKLRGAFKKDPQRKRTDPPSKGPLGRAPTHLTKAQQKIWREIVKCAPHDILTMADRFAIENMSILIHEGRTSSAKMTDGRRLLLRTYLGQFGMTPADRAKISVPPQPPTNPFDGI